MHTNSLADFQSSECNVEELRLVIISVSDEYKCVVTLSVHSLLQYKASFKSLNYVES